MPGLRTMNLSYFLPPMTPFSNIRSKRSTAFVVLLVWLFALASGVANACLLESRTTHGHETSVTHSSSEKEVPSISAGHTGVIAGHGADSDTARAPCLKVCEDGSQSLNKTRSGVDSADPGPAPLVRLVWTVAAPPLLARKPVEQLQSPEPRVPIRVRFARLTI